MKLKILLTSFFLLLAIAGLHAQVIMKNLRCEMLKNPLGIDVTQPRFSWQLESRNCKSIMAMCGIPVWSIATAPCSSVMQGRNYNPVKNITGR